MAPPRPLHASVERDAKQPTDGADQWLIAKLHTRTRRRIGLHGMVEDDLEGRGEREGQREVSNAVGREQMSWGTDVRCSQPGRGSVYLEGGDGGRDGDCRSTEGSAYDGLLLHGGVLEARVLIHGRVGTHCVLVGAGVAEEARARVLFVRERAIDADGEGRRGLGLISSAVDAAGNCVEIPERSEMKLIMRLVNETSGQDKRTRAVDATTSTVRWEWRR